MNTTVIETVFNFHVATEQKKDQHFTVNAIRQYAAKHGIFAKTETVTRALRHLKHEGAIKYEHLTNGLYLALPFHSV